MRCSPKVRKSISEGGPTFSVTFPQHWDGLIFRASSDDIYQDLHKVSQLWSPCWQFVCFLNAYFRKLTYFHEQTAPEKWTRLALGSLTQARGVFYRVASNREVARSAHACMDAYMYVWTMELTLDNGTSRHAPVGKVHVSWWALFYF